jgi:hypothetical protein
LENVLQSFDQANVQLLPGNFVFAQAQVHYLRFVLSEQGVAASPGKIKAVKNYPLPKNVKDVREFLRLASFYRKLLDNFDAEAKPLTELTKKDRPFIWGPEQQKTFESLKDKLCKALELAFPDFSLLFNLTTNASKTAVAVMLSQIQNGVERPISYGTRQLNKAEQAYSASESEMLALVWTSKQFRNYQFGKQFLARTDQAALTYLRNFADNNSRLMR